MAIFSGKIIEAYYSNQEKTTLEVIYKNGEKAYSHYLKVDPNHPDFQDLIKEYSLEKILKRTTERLNNYRKQIKDTLTDAQKSISEDVNKAVENNSKEFYSFLLNYDESKSTHTEKLYTLKLNAFELEKVKNSKDEDKKTSLRTARTSLEVFKILETF